MDNMSISGAVELRPYRRVDAPAVTALLRDYLVWATGRLREVYGVDESPTDLDTIHESLDSFVPPFSLLVVAEGRDELLGVGGVRTIAPGVAEVKRMYVVPEARGLGLGSAILDHLVDQARSTMGASTIRLDTCGFMTDAQRLYASRGFVERTPYEGTEIPPHLQRYWRFFERSAVIDSDADQARSVRRTP